MAYPTPTAGQYNSPAFQAFLAAHPTLAGMEKRADVTRFLDNHPDIARRYTQLINPQPATSGAAAAATPAAAAAAPTTAQQSARAVIQSTLNAYGLGALGDWAWQQYLNGVPESKIFLDIQQRPEYKTRFAGLDALRAKGRAISEDEYIAKEQSYAATLRAYGLPPGTYDSPDDFAALIAGEVSPQEFNDRLAYREQVVAANPQAQAMRNALARDYGLTEANGLTLAYWINPDVGSDEIKKRFTAAQAAGTADVAGFGTLTRQQAETVGSLGLTRDQLQSAFTQLGNLDELRTAAIGDSGSTAVSQQDMLDAAFTGSGAAQKKLKREQERRVSAFEGGGSFAAGQSGISGLGSATR